MTPRMHAMLLDRPGEPLRSASLSVPDISDDEVLIRVSCCGLCRTDLHVRDGELPEPKLPLILGHQIVGVVEQTGSRAHGLSVGQRVGVPWLGRACGACEHCLAGRENLCDGARFTGYHLDGGFAEWARASARFALPLPEGYPDLQVAPLLCAGLIGHRALGAAGDGLRVGLYGFGASAHIVAQVARHQGREVFAFTRPGDAAAQALARRLGVAWAGGSDTAPPEALDAAIIFAPVGALVVSALSAIKKGGRVVCAGIVMSDIPSFPYELLWGERRIESVANLTRKDGVEFLALAPRVPVRTEVTGYALQDAERALDDLRSGKLTGAAVIEVARPPAPP